MENNNYILDPSNGLELSRTEDGFLTNITTGKKYLEREGKFIALVDPICGGELIPQSDGKFYSKILGETFTYECANEGDEPHFYPEYLPYSGMTHVKAKVIDGKLVGENGIEFPIKNGQVKTPTTEGLTTQEEIDNDIADFEEISNTIIANKEALVKYEIEQAKYDANCRVLDIYRTMISDFMKRGMPIEEVVSSLEDIFSNLGTKFIENPLPEGAGKPQIKDYIPNPTEPEMPSQISMDSRLEEKIKTLTENNINYYKREEDIENLILAARTNVNELEFNGYKQLRSNKELSAEKRIESVHGMNKQKVEMYRNLLQQITDIKASTIEDIIQQYGSRFNSFGIYIDFNPTPKEDGKPLSVSDYIPDPQMPELVSSTKEGLTERSVGEVAKNPKLASIYLKAKEIYNSTIGKYVDKIKDRQKGNERDE